MHILLTGSAGSVGSAVLLHLLEKSHTVTSVDIVPIPSTIISQIKPSDEIKYTHNIIDLMRYEELETLFNTHGPFDSLIHLSAIPNPLFHDARVVHNTNVVTTYNVLKTAVDHGIKRIVQASSVNAIGLTYSPLGRQMFDELPITEDAPMRSVSVLLLPAFISKSDSTPVESLS